MIQLIENLDSSLLDIALVKQFKKYKIINKNIEDDSYAYILCSNFSYLYDKIIRSWRQSRVVSIQDLSEIQYSKSMNLTELIYRTDGTGKNIVKKEEQKNIKTLVLKLERF